MASQEDKFRVLRKLPEVRFEEELRGYSKSQVDRVLQSLAPLADDVGALQARLSAAETRAGAAEARVNELLSAPPAPAPAPAAPAEPTAPPDFDETLSRTLLLAQRTADQAVSEAKAEAAALREASQAEAEQARQEMAEARRQMEAELAAERQSLSAAAHEEVQAKVEAAEASLAQTEAARRHELAEAIHQLISQRDELLATIEGLEGHLAHRREVIRTALADVAIIVDDPSRLHAEMPPSVEPISAPVLDAGPVVLDVPELDGLAPEELGDGPIGVPEPVSVPVADSVDLSDDVTDADQFDGGPPTQAMKVVLLDDVEGQGIDAAVSTPVVDLGAADNDPSWSDAEALAAAQPSESETSASETAESVAVKAEPVVEAVPEPTPEPVRPSWADAVPDVEEAPVRVHAEDPFLDELRRATSEDADSDEVLDRFLSDESGQDRRGGGWFNRRR